jgi:hypothetical protein
MRTVLLGKDIEVNISKVIVKQFWKIQVYMNF